MLITLIRKKTHYVIYGFIAIFVISCFYMYGANRAGNAGAKGPQESRLSKNVLSVDGKVVSRSAFNNKYLQFKRQYEQMAGTSFDSYPMKKYLEAVVAESIVNQDLLLQEAKKRGMKADGPEVNKRINMEMSAYVGGVDPSSDPSIQGRIKGFFGSKDRMDKFKDILYRRGMTFEDYKANIERDVLQDKITKAIAAEKSAEEKKKALDASNSIVEKLKTGEPFESVAFQFSDDDSTKTKGGEIGWINRGMISKEIENAAFSMVPGQVSNPIESPMGYHIIKVMDRKHPEGEEYEAAKNDIVAEIRKENGDEKAIITEDQIKAKYERVRVAHILSKLPEERELADNWVRAERAKGIHKIEILDPDLKAYKYLNRQMLEPDATPPDMDEAEKLYNAAIDQDPENQYLHFQLGTIYEQKNNTLKINAETSEAVAPGEDPYAAAIAAEDGSTESAETTSEVVTAGEGAEAAEKVAKVAEVETIDETAVAAKEVVPTAKDAKEKTATDKAQSDKYLQEAYDEYKKAVDLSESAQYYDSMILMAAARVADKLNKGDEAVKYYVTAVEFSPADKLALERIKKELEKYDSKQAVEGLKTVNERIAEFEAIEAEEAASEELQQDVGVEESYEEAIKKALENEEKEPIVDENEVPVEAAPAPVPES